MSDDSDETTPRRRHNHFDPVDTDIAAENNKLRRKLKELNRKLEEELIKVNKLKEKQSINLIHITSPANQSVELQNAYKMIERLQKTVKEYEGKETYQISQKKVLDLESEVRKR